MMDKNEIKKWVWFLACIYPISVTALLWNTPTSLMVAMVVFVLTGWIVPWGYHFLAFLKKGEVNEKRKAVIHFIVWPAIIFFLSIGLWTSLEQWITWRTENYGLFFLMATGMTIFSLVITEFLSACLTWVYKQLCKKADWVRYWITMAFLGGFLPLSFIVAVTPLAMMGAYNLPSDILVFFISSLIQWIFLGKIILVMAVFAFYYYGVIIGSRKERLAITTLSAFFYMVLIFLPSVAFRSFFGISTFYFIINPQMLFICPVLSDFFLCGLSLYAGRKVASVFFEK